MNRWSLLGFAVAAVAVAAPARAGIHDESWAKCIWQKAPVSAANWLALPEAKRDYGLKEPEPAYVLQFRLRASCHSLLTPLGKDVTTLVRPEVRAKDHDCDATRRDRGD